MLKALVAFLVMLPSSGWACSLVACIDGGPAFSSSFTVQLKYERKPLRGGTVRIMSNGDLRFSGATDADGTLRVSKLAPGEYWMEVEFLGINAAYHCFHIAQDVSVFAKRRASYEWGRFGTPTRRVAGTLVDSQPGTGESPLWNQVHRVKRPIRGSTVIIQNPLTGVVLKTKSDADGNFVFDPLRDGQYVLRVEGGASNRDFAFVDMLVHVSSKAQGDRLILTKSDAGAGTCGGTSVQIDAVN
ncbi:MSCRAMM family protein [Paludibaculum fermentans]|uniref:SD-repeat containing protein B domain-containing protein n=1 Tax=Paludibaculum fermentans TaxID=1473598 RepID=A0A7S7NPP4_PALFE|nr:carboxypeptidase-like regulatory domain-containing protein [Paludibaculum fermentans]QOY87435.1 hypothetical protein IRI77_32530 [Paludibaculum fermentans]